MPAIGVFGFSFYTGRGPFVCGRTKIMHAKGGPEKNWNLAITNRPSILVTNTPPFIVLHTTAFFSILLHDDAFSQNMRRLASTKQVILWLGHKRGSVRLIFTVIVTIVPLEPCHHKPMGRPPSYIPLGLWWHCYNGTNLVKMSFTDPHLTC